MKIFGNNLSRRKTISRSPFKQKLLPDINKNKKMKECKQNHQNELESYYSCSKNRQINSQSQLELNNCILGQ